MAKQIRIFRFDPTRDLNHFFKKKKLGKKSNKIKKILV